MLLMGRNEGIERSAVVLGALVTILLLTLVALLAAGPIMRVLGAKIEAVITRLLGVLLAALAVQFVIDGIRVSLA
jgi:multiple antibiotic resistance protein